MTDHDTTGQSVISEAPTTGARRRVAPLAAGLVALVVAALVLVLVVAGDGDRAADGASPLLGQVAPPAAGELADGAPFTLSRRRGSFVVLNFFTHNCVPCIREHPELIEFVAQQRAIGVDGAELYTIVRESTRAQVEEFFAERGGDWPIVYDPRNEFSNDFGVALVPETWVIDPRGVVQARFQGEIDAESLGALIQRLRAALAEATDGGAPAP